MIMTMLDDLSNATLDEVDAVFNDKGDVIYWINLG